MTTLNRISSLAFVLALAAILAFAPAPVLAATVYGGSTDTTSTTLSAAIAANTTTQWCVASATGIVLPSLSGNAVGSYLMVDKEAAQVVRAGTSTTCFIVRRGTLGTSANYAHANAATVWVGNAAISSGDTSRPFTGAFVVTPPSGTCTASAQYALPVIVTGGDFNGTVYAGDTYYCTAGYWTKGVPQAPPQPYTQFTTFTAPGIPLATLGSVVTDIAGQEWFSQINVEFNATSTGACLLNGTATGTDKWIFILWDAAGKIVANTAVAGVLASGSSTYTCQAWTAPINLQGPSTYFIGIQGNGTAATFYAYATAGVPTKYGTGIVAAGTFATLLPITPTTTFTTAVGPMFLMY
jgi:hypothetical protein